MNQQAETSAAQQIDNANKFVFTDHDGTTHVVFYPEAPGPIPSDPTKRGARLDYEGVEGTFTFLGQQIENQPGPLGSLITVALEASIDAGALTFSLALPPVNMAGKKKETFQHSGDQNEKLWYSDQRRCKADLHGGAPERCC